MKKLLWLATVTSVGFILMLFFPPQRFAQAQTPGPGIAGKSAQTILYDMLSGAEEWYVFDADGNLKGFFHAPSRVFKLENSKNSSETSNEGNLAIKTPNGFELEVTGMRLDGNLNSYGNVSLWVSPISTPKKEEWTIVGNYNFSPATLQYAIDLAQTYAVILR